MRAETLTSHLPSHYIPQWEENQVNCIKCRAEIPAGGIFCPFCGKKQIKEPRKALKRANGTGTVYKLQGRRRRPWVAARNRTILGYYETKTAALECLNRLAGREISERYNMTFEEVFDAWKTEHYQTLTASGRSQYDISFQVFSGLHKSGFFPYVKATRPNLLSIYNSFKISFLS